ncbi:hypothetical protein D0T53_13040 [Dysgonomonas sp. 216]|uniref:PIN domain-containing protein n=1 Tax=Dysgonomonas sp. 216 TaxID=2302934 RepID=UPI0013D635CB|nr:PIN domain-containing protein [Dysgonomonas sp. 216]NDW19826.1 hypothetical protein [Dysgonomonas sp. 216]
MVHLILDTNIWLYIANNYIGDYKGQGHLKLFDRLKTANRTGAISIYMNDIILTEWGRNQDAQIDYIQKLKKKLKEKAELVALENIIGSTEALNIVKKEFSEKIDTLIKENEDHVRNVENFMLDCKYLDIKDEHKIKVVDLGIHKKAPFHNSKNNINDALILYSFDDYLKDMEITVFDDFYFVSNNHEEYCSPDDFRIFHDDIRNNLESHLSYGNYHELWRILKLSKELQEELEEEIRFWTETNDELFDIDYFECKSSECYGYEDNTPFGYSKEEMTVKYLSEEAFKHQLNLFQEEEYTREINTATNTSWGRCNECGSIHFICPHCKSIICHDEHEFKCPECATTYELKKIKSDLVLYINDIGVADDDNNEME